MMRANVENTCAQHQKRSDCPDCLISYSERWNAYGIMIHDGGSSSIGIQFCPWCGQHLPKTDEMDLDNLGADQGGAE